MITGPVGRLIASGASLAGSVAGFLVPQEPKEQKFHWEAKTADAFSKNVQIVVEAIDNWIDKHYKGQIDDIKSYIEEPGNIFSVVEKGRYTIDPDPPLVAPTDDNIVANIAAPLTNQLMIDQQLVVVVFSGQGWREQHFDLCGDKNLKVFPELQEGEDLFCDESGNLGIIMEYATEQLHGKWMYHDHVRNVVGLDELPSYSITRRQIMEASMFNQDKDGYGHAPQLQDAIDNLNGMESSQQLVWSKLGIWNLPVCYVNPIDKGDKVDLKFVPDHIEEWMAASFTLTCMDQTDIKGNPWPMGRPWCDDYFACSNGYGS